MRPFSNSSSPGLEEIVVRRDYSADRSGCRMPSDYNELRATGNKALRGVSSLRLFVETSMRTHAFAKYRVEYLFI